MVATSKIDNLTEKLTKLFEYSNRHTLNAPQGRSTLCSRLGLSESYLYGPQKEGRLKVAVERAILATYGISPPHDGGLGDPSSGWTIFLDNEWRSWRNGSADEFGQVLYERAPKPPSDFDPFLVETIRILKTALPRQSAAESTNPVEIAEPNNAVSGTVLGDRFAEALVYVMNLEKGRFRITGAPVMSHIFQVAGIVLENNGSEDEAIAALLHDAAEDHDASKVLPEIKQRFGKVVHDVIIECSDRFLSPDKPKEDWLTRKRTFLKRIPNASFSALNVVTADKLHNARAMLRDARAEGEAFWGRLNRPREATIAYFSCAHRLLARSHPIAATNELGLTVALLESSACNSYDLKNWVKLFGF